MPLASGGLGIPSAKDISEPAYLGSIASVWHKLLDLIPDLHDNQMTVKLDVTARTGPLAVP